MININENNVKISRLQKGLTQQQLAQIVGVTRQTVSLIEKGKYNPSLKLCIHIAKAVGKSLDELFWLERMDGKNENN